MFDLPTSVTVSGCEYPIRTDFRVILEIFVMLDDPDLTDADKTAALLRISPMQTRPQPCSGCFMYGAKLAQKGTDRLTQKPLSGPSLTSLIRVMGTRAKSLPAVS